MNRKQIVELVAETGGLEQVVDVADRLVDELESRGLLNVGDARRWRVTVDDPNAAAAYVYEDVEAATAAGACLIGARRAIVEDPGATIGPGEVDEEHRKALADGPATSGLIQSVVRFTIAVELPSGGEVCEERGYCVVESSFTDPPGTPARCPDCGRTDGGA